MGSGFASMIAHAGTSPFQVYAMPKNLGRDMYVGTSVLFFAATNLMKAPAFLALGQLSVSQFKTSLIFFPLAMASSWLGVRLVRTIDVRKFNFTITLILLCVSIALARAMWDFENLESSIFGYDPWKAGIGERWSHERPTSPHLLQIGSCAAGTHWACSQRSGAGVLRRPSVMWWST
jgi:hypothetical protein